MRIVRLLKQTWLERYRSKTFELGAALAFNPASIRLCFVLLATSEIRTNVHI